MEAKSLQLEIVQIRGRSVNLIHCEKITMVRAPSNSKINSMTGNLKIITQTVKNTEKNIWEMLLKLFVVFRRWHIAPYMLYCYQGGLHLPNKCSCCFHPCCFIPSVIIFILGLNRPITTLNIKEKRQIKNHLGGRDTSGRQKLITLYLPFVTKRKFLLTISIHYQA